MSEHAKGAAGPHGSTSTRPAAQRIQTKLAVSDRHDPMEREADSVADRITAGQPAPAVSRMAAPEKKPDTAARQAQPEKKKEPVQRAAKEERKPETPVQRAAAPEKREPAVQRAAAPEKREPTMPVQRQADERKEVQTKAAGDGAGASMGHVAQQAVDSKGSGRPLDSGVRSRIESSLGADVGHVRVHDDPGARAAASALNARAFTHGSDIWMGPGESSSDLRLMAHEATHVVQQGGAAQRLVQRTDGPGTPAPAPAGGAPATPPAGVTPITPVPEDGPYEFIKDDKRYKYIANSSPKELHLPEVRVPNFKERHQGLHTVPLAREPGERDTNQREIWRNHFNSAVAQPLHESLDLAVRHRGFSGDGDDRRYYFKGTRNQQLMLFGRQQQLLEAAVFPFWDRQQEARTFQVDHRREDQLGGVDHISNYEFLDAGANGSSGSRIGREINAQIGTAVSVYQSGYYRNLIGGGARRISGNPSYIKDNYRLQFNEVRYDLGSVPNGDRYWSVDQITQGQHLQAFRPLTAREDELLGEARRPLLFASPTGGIPIRAPQSAGQRVEIWPRVVATGPLQIVDEESATLQVDAYRSGEDPNGLQASYPSLTFFFRPVPGMDAWAIDKQRSLQQAQQGGAGGVFQSLRLPGLSPIRIDALDLDPGQGFVGRGKLLPSVPLFSAADIDVGIQGGDIRLQKTFNLEEISVPSPFEIYHSSLTAFAGTQGLGMEGLLGFGINRLGEGELRAEISTGAGLSLGGRFAFDQRLFGEGTNAEARVGYRENQWSMGGTLSIPEGRVPGVRSATINVDYSEGSGFSAQGAAQLNVPGVESGTLSVTQSEESGFAIGGSFNLSPDIPGIRGGTLSAELRQRPGGEGYALRASGEAQPDIPGINSNLAVNYNDGAFTATVDAQYSRGMLSGRINAGVTNRSVGADGQLSETAAPDDPLIVYGGGNLTIQIAPWLEGTAGVQFAPNGEITVTGEIGLPSQIEIFSRKQIDRTLLNIAVQAPIFPGIVAEIGGGLSAQAGIGPGVIDQLRLGITYNPAHEEQTHVTGDAHLNIPADAGLRLAVRAGIGLGITGASATGGLEIGGMLGIGGAAEAGVQVDWLPSTGLRIDAYGDIHAEPIFRFDISGYVSVRAIGFEVYGNTWELASYEFGSNLGFGVRFPIHYVEGEPFDISLSDVEFTVPDIDPGELLSSLVDRIA